MFTFSLVVVLNKEAYDMAGVDDTVSFTTILLGPWFLGLCSKVNSKSIDYLEIVDFDSMPLI